MGIVIDLGFLLEKYCCRVVKINLDIVFIRVWFFE